MFESEKSEPKSRQRTILHRQHVRSWKWRWLDCYTLKKYLYPRKLDTTLANK